MNRFGYFAYWLYARLYYGFHMQKPGYPLRVFKNLVRAKYLHLTKKRDFVLRGIDFALTYRCNFDCEHCYAKRLYDGKKELLKIKDYQRICQEAMDLGCLCFSLQGGEIFLRKDWEKIVEAFLPRRNHLLITTNGYLVDEKLVIRLKELGIDTLYFSVDSGYAKEHDAFRKKEGSFARIISAVSCCKKHGIKVVFNTCVTKNNLYSEGLKRLLDFCHRKKILVETIFARCLGNYAMRKDVMLGEEDLLYYYRLRRRYPLVVRDLDNNYGAWGCPAGKEVLYITPYGDVCPCPYSHISLGNVRNESLERIRRRAIENRWYGSYQKECLTALNPAFMRLYYPMVEKKPLLEIKDLKNRENR